ncbi:MAG: hypothetical protein ACPGLY_25890 [Rubripirellula sp.]
MGIAASKYNFEQSAADLAFEPHDREALKQSYQPPNSLLALTATEAENVVTRVTRLFNDERSCFKVVS